jgi:hypothetical protein
MKFSEKWEKGTPPPIHCVFAISNPYLQQSWDTYKQSLRTQESEEHFHGTSLTCNITASQTLCGDRNCGICGISGTGLNSDHIGRKIDFQRFGKGFYLAPNSSKCHDYTEGAYGYRAMLLCDVLPGRKYNLKTNNEELTGPPPGYDSVYGQIGRKLNYPEIVIYKEQAVMPRYIVVYKKNGTKHPLAK